jgi:hypothetical protein
MDKFITLPEKDKKVAFQEAANRRGILPIIIEKDFWVCWALKQLFSHAELAPNLTFKGGTSLSKAYNLIERFSEDIDLTISKDAPYIINGSNPMEAGISGKERQRRIDALKVNAKLFVSEVVLPTLQQSFVNILPTSSNWELILDPDDRDEQTILFHYPKLMAGSDTEAGRDYYIKPVVRLEFGARGDIEPSEDMHIIPYVAEDFPQLFSNPYFNVHVLALQRTFWEKATILHSIYHGAKMKAGMSRHYYDMFTMAQKGVADTALQHKELLDMVVQNKSLMFADNKASYGTAVIGALHLIPKNDIKATLKKDYADMQEMFMGEAPDFEAMMSGLSALEQRINKAK